MNWFWKFFDTTTDRFDEYSRLVVVDGNIGAGKTTIAKEIARKFDMLYIPGKSTRMSLSEEVLNKNQSRATILSIVHIKRTITVLTGTTTIRVALELFLISTFPEPDSRLIFNIDAPENFDMRDPVVQSKLHPRNRKFDLEDFYENPNKKPNR